MSRYLLVIAILYFSLYANGQSFTISGYIEDADSGEKLIAANAFNLKSLDGTITNTYGFYSLTLPADSVYLSASYIGYQSSIINFKLRRDTIINFKLSASVEMEVVEISAERSKQIEEQSQMSTIEVPIAQIKKIPALLGEVDVLKALQLLPGVQSGGEGQSGLYVRGGSPDQNLILLDGVPVYNASHLFGFFSVFNADAIKNVKLIKGGYPARYGGRLSSVLEINMKEGNNKEFHGAASIGLLSSKFMFEGPIVSEKTSFIVSGRRTYLDVLARPFIKDGFESDGQEGSTGYYFYDLNAKINHKFNQKDRLYLSTYLGRDRFYFDSKDNSGTFRDYVKTDFGWGNFTSALRWNHLINQKLFSNLTLTYSRYKLDTGTAFGTEIEDNPNLKEEISIDYLSGINDLALNLDFDFLPTPNHFVKFGASIIYHTFKPGSFDLKESIPQENYEFERTVGQKDVTASEFALYVEDDFEITDRLKVNTGIHFSGFNVTDAFYHSTQPRLSGRYLFDGNLSLKASFATMRQYVHLLAYEGIGLPTDLWLPTTNKVKPQDSWQAALGIAKTYKSAYELSAEIYYREMKNVIAYKDGSGLFELSDWQDRVTQGEGDSYGLELFAQKKQGRVTGWIGYTLSWSNRRFDDLNFGKEFPFRYDRRNDFSTVVNFEWTKSISISGAWIYGTGNAVTLANSNYAGSFSNPQNDWSTNGSFYENRNNFRMRSYHRLDFGINFKKQKPNYSRTWSLGAYNSYNRKNPFFIYEDFQTIEQPDGSFKREFVLKQSSLFPIIPYVTYSIEF